MIPAARRRKKRSKSLLPVLLLCLAAFGLLRLTECSPDPVQEAAVVVAAPSGCRVTLVCLGELRTVSTQAQTVGQLIQEAGVMLTEEDFLTPSPDTPVDEGMTVCINRLSCRTESVVRSIPRETVCRIDTGLQADETVILEYGQDGQMLCTEAVSFWNGQEIGRRTLETEILTPAVNTVLLRGAAVPEDSTGTVISTDTIRLPTGEVLSYSGTASVRATAYTHTDSGCDTVTATGTTVRRGTVAVDPQVIPYGTEMFILASDGSYIYGIARAEDCGGDIRGDRMDLYLPTFEECIRFGRRECTVFFLN